MSKPVRPPKGLVTYRLMMIIGSFAPLFILLIIKGSPTITDKNLQTVSLVPENIYSWTLAALAIIPTLAICLRIRHSLKAKDSRTITAGEVTDSREQLLIYLLPLILPLYQNSYSSMRDVWAVLALMLFIIYILYHLDLHYMNLIFAFFGYRVYTVRAEDSKNPANSQCPFVILSRRHNIPSGVELSLHRISDTVYIEYESVV